MPGDNLILVRWHAESQEFHRNLSLLRSQMQPEPVHDIRVAIKKLRSYLKLCSALLTEKELLECFQATRELFSTLGKHRNLEITRDLFIRLSHKDSLNSEFLLYLQLLQDQLTPFCDKAIQLYDGRELDELTKTLHQQFQDLGPEAVESRAKDVIAAAIEEVKKDVKHFKKKSHLIRKRFKDVFYWSKIFEQDIFFTKQELKTLDRILNHLGNIQDHEVLTMNLSYFRKTVLPPNTAGYEQLKEMELATEKKQEALLRKGGKLTEKLLLAT